MSYDAWLEAPYQKNVEEGDAFMEWCENQNVDPDEEGSWDAFEDAMVDRERDAGEAKAEALAEGAYYDYDF